MNALIVTLLRFAFLAALWLFVFFVAVTVKNDVYGQQVTRRNAGTKTPKRKSMKKTHAEHNSAAHDDPLPPSDDYSALGAPAAKRIVVVQGPLSGTALSLRSGSILVGRSPDSALVLDDGYASARHARFYTQGGDVIVEDLESTNGTWVNGRRIYQPTVLQPRVPVTIGKTVLELAP